MVIGMIKTFRCRDTQLLANDEPVKRFKAIERIAQWRVCFRWDDGAEDVEIVDYH